MTAPVEPGASLDLLMRRVSEFVTSLTDDQITGLLDGTLQLGLIDNDVELKIRQCARCAGEGCSTCDDTGVIYP